MGVLPNVFSLFHTVLLMYPNQITCTKFHGTRQDGLMRTMNYIYWWSHLPWKWEVYK